jgi:hypothetical protein
MKNITRPAENLSNREYIPKTNAPVLALVPTTSEMKFIPVDKTIVCETPKNKIEDTYKWCNDIHYPTSLFCQK